MDEDLDDHVQDFWGGEAGPLPPPWEIPPLQSCGDYFRERGAAAWADPRFGTHAYVHIWAKDLPCILDRVPSPPILLTLCCTACFWAMIIAMSC